ncbi:MAG: hypothetical protein AB7S38_42780 [Vulcanimicrobiota bacterium]
MRPSRLSRRPWAISLLELVMALAFCGLALLAVVGLQARYQQALVKDDLRSQAEAVAQSLLQRAEASLRTDFAVSVDQPRQLVAPGFEAEVASQQPTPGTKKVEVTVYFQDRQGAQTARLWCIYSDKE